MSFTVIAVTTAVTAGVSVINAITSRKQSKKIEAQRQAELKKLNEEQKDLDQYAKDRTIFSQRRINKNYKRKKTYNGIHGSAKF